MAFETTDHDARLSMVRTIRQRPDLRHRSPGAWLAIAASGIAAVALAVPAGAQQAPVVPPAAAAAAAQAQSEAPDAVVQRLHDALERSAAAHPDDFDGRYRVLEPVVLATHDLPYIAELTIRREWAGLSEDARRRFVDAFVELSVTTYASRFAGLATGSFEAGGSEDLAGGRSRVTATLTTPGGDAIPFEYVLHEAGDGWRIVNILADNVSDLALKRAEYRRLLDSGTIEDVIAALRRQAAEAGRGR
jgi:phospholipid transport system substrate-binding protein